MEPKATPKQKAFVGKFIESKNATKAAKHAGYSIRSAQQIGSENLLKPVVQNEIRRQLEISGLTDDYLDKSTERLIEAGLKNSKWTKPIVALQAIAMVNKLKDRFPATKVLTANIDLTAELEGKDTPELLSLLKNVQVQNKKLMERMESVDNTP